MRKSNLSVMINELMAINNFSFKIPSIRTNQIKLLNDLRTVTLPEVLSNDYIQAEKIILKEQLDEITIVDVEHISDKLIDNIYIYKGDITKIKADAIVNAANEKLLGCFLPGHHCIDNAIHLGAGLKLRMACHKIMKQQGYDEPVGEAKVTNGYHLPSKYVVHTVGPNLNGLIEVTMDEVIKQLEQCYVSILEAVHSFEDINSLVFCSISTGVYGVPIEAAADVALRSIKRYLSVEEHHLKKVIINVFSKEDYDVYNEKAKRL